MKKTLRTVKSTVSLLGALALTALLSTWAATDVEPRKEEYAYPEKHLPLGQRAGGYRSKLEATSSRVTAVNSNKLDHTEYKIVEENQASKIWNNIDKAARKATTLNIGSTVAMSEATKQTRPGKGQLIFADPPEDSHRYSDQNRARTKQIIAELEALPIGRDKPFYREALRKRAYEVTTVNADSGEVLNLEAVKNGQSVRFTVDFNDKTGKSVKVGAAKLWWESKATHAARIKIY